MNDGAPSGTPTAGLDLPGLSALDWTIIVVYLVGLIYMSYKLGEGQEDVEDYYLGGGALPWWAIGLSTMSTQLSTNSMLGIPAFVAFEAGGGLAGLQTELALPLAVILVMAVLHPFFRTAGVISIYEYLELRFGVKSRTVLSVLFQLSRALATGVTIYSVSFVFEVALGIPLAYSILLIGVVTVIYDTLGGMAAVVYSDVLQMGIIFGGVCLCTGLAIQGAGGLETVLTTFPAERYQVLRLDQWGFAAGEDYSFWAMLFGYFFLYASYYGCDQSQVQRQLSSKDVDDARLSLFMNGVGRFGVVALLSLMGLAVGAYLIEKDPTFVAMIRQDPELQNRMVIYYILTALPSGVVGLLIVAIFSAALSSLDSAINSLSATTMRDIVERFFLDDVKPAQHLTWSKVLTVFWGAFCTLCAFATPWFGNNVVIVINKVGSLTYGPILGIFLLAIFTRRVDDSSATYAVLAGVLFNVFLWLQTPISWLWWNVAGCLVTVAVGPALALTMAPEPDLDKLEGLVYEADSEARFGCQRYWPAYYGALVGAFVLFTMFCVGFQNLGSGH